MNTNNPSETCNHCEACLEVCICAQMGHPSVASYLARGELGGAWISSNCWRCEEVCPERLDFFSIMAGRRRVEKPPPTVLEAVKNIKETGCVFQIQGLNASRKAHDLEPVRMIDRRKLFCLIENG